MRPIIGITMGDPSGVGPEISCMVLAKEETYRECRPLMIASPAVMERALRDTGLTGLQINKVASPGEGQYKYGVIDVLDPGLGDMLPPSGVVNAAAGEMAFQCVVKVIELAMNGEIDATVTNPLNKEAMNMAGHHFAGHTEIYAHYTKTDKYSMLLVHENLRVVHVSTHVSLREACDLVKKDRVLDCIRLAHDSCRRLDLDSPRIAVAGLNPHCGEGGLFGNEEMTEIMPAVEAARQEGINVSGPIAPDTVFSKAVGGWYDAVVAMYHDQGHIPMKLKGFVYDPVKKSWDSVAGVNITCGLPIIRSSVDHGTAMGHAGKGNANPVSLLNAIDCAVRLARHKEEK